MQLFKATLARFNSELWAFHIMVPPRVSSHFLESKNLRIICSLNDECTFHAALMPAGNGQYFINVNKEIRKKLGVIIGDELSVKLEADESEYGIAVPPEFLEWIRQDPHGSKLFHALTKGKQRSLIYIMGKPKRSETRLTKTMAIFEYLTSTNGMLDFKELHDFIKRFNQLNS